MTGAWTISEDWNWFRIHRLSTDFGEFCVQSNGQPQIWPEL